MKWISAYLGGKTISTANHKKILFPGALATGNFNTFGLQIGCMPSSKRSARPGKVPFFYFKVLVLLLRKKTLMPGRALRLLLGQATRLKPHCLEFSALSQLSLINNYAVSALVLSPREKALCATAHNLKFPVLTKQKWVINYAYRPTS